MRTQSGWEEGEAGQGAGGEDSGRAAGQLGCFVVRTLDNKGVFGGWLNWEGLPSLIHMRWGSGKARNIISYNIMYLGSLVPRICPRILRAWV